VVNKLSNKSITENIFVDKTIIKELLSVWSKPETDKQSRAKFLKGIIKQSNMSQRTFCKTFNIPKSTLTGWLVWDKISPKQYQKLKDQEVPERIIHETLKSTISTGEEAVEKIISNNVSEFESDIDRCISILKPYTRDFPSMENGLAMKIHDLREVVMKIVNYYR